MGERKVNEKIFHNLVRHADLKLTADFEYLTSNKKWYSITRKSRGAVEKWLAETLQGKKVLDYCCGNGEMSIRMAQMGASLVVGIDISDVSIENAKSQAQKEGLAQKTAFQIMDAENLAFAENYFDVIYESGVLHHLNLNKAYLELARVIKPDGKIICNEALAHNLIIHFYRKITPHLRTEWEVDHIFRKKNIEMAKNYFNEVEILGFYHLTTLAAVPFRNQPIFHSILSMLEILDSVLLKLPVLKWQAWQVVFVLSRPIR